MRLAESDITVVLVSYCVRQYGDLGEVKANVEQKGWDGDTEIMPHEYVSHVSGIK